jgi:hypothetical protein
VGKEERGASRRLVEVVGDVVVDPGHVLEPAAGAERKGALLRTTGALVEATPLGEPARCIRLAGTSATATKVPVLVKVKWAPSADTVECSTKL